RQTCQSANPLPTTHYSLLTTHHPLPLPTPHSHSSVMAADVPHDHALPPRPVVGEAIPDTQRIADSLVPEDRRELAILVDHRVTLADGHDDVHPANRVETLLVPLIRDERVRV